MLQVACVQSKQRNYAVSRCGEAVSPFRIENVCRRAIGVVNPLRPFTPVTRPAVGGRSAALLIACSVLREFSSLSSASNSASSCHFRVAPLRLSCPPPTDLGLHVSSVRRSVSLPPVAEFIVPVPTAGRLVFWRRVLSGRWLERDFVALCRVTSGLTLSRAPPRPAIFVFARLQRQLSRAVRL